MMNCDICTDIAIYINTNCSHIRCMKHREKNYIYNRIEIYKNIIPPIKPIKNNTHRRSKYTCFCGSKAYYGSAINGIKVSCYLHKTLYQVNLSSNKCYCNRSACYGFKFDKIPVACFKHKLPDHVYLYSKCCMCSKPANYINERKGTHYCSNHKNNFCKSLNMIRSNLGYLISIKNLTNTG